jgi:hypothetical protein
VKKLLLSTICAAALRAVPARLHPARALSALLAVSLALAPAFGADLGVDPALAAVAMMALTTAPFPVQPELTAIALAYRNQRLIANDVLPRVGVGTQEFKYLTYNKADRFTIPNTLVGRRSKPNEVEFGAAEVTSKTEDYALDDPIPQADIDNAPPNYDPRGNAVEGIMDLIELDREKRTADLVFAAANYPSGNKVTLSGTSQWSDFTNSTPLADLQTGLDTPIMRANVMVIGRLAFSKLVQHPDVVKAMHGTSGDKGIATRQFLADLLELEEVLVGEAWVNTAKPGQAATFARLWGKHCALLHRNRTANTRRGVTFGLTAEWGSRVAGSQRDTNIGMRGGERVRAGESVKELIVASDVGYFLEDVIA